MQPLWRTVWRFLRKLKIELLYDPAIPLLGIYPDKTRIQKDTCTPMFIAALLLPARGGLELGLGDGENKEEKRRLGILPSPEKRDWSGLGGGWSGGLRDICVM